MCRAYIHANSVRLHLDLAGVRSLSQNVVAPVYEHSRGVGDARVSTIQAMRATYRGKDIVNANEMPLRTSKATAATLRNCISAGVFSLDSRPDSRRYAVPSRVRSREQAQQLALRRPPAVSSTGRCRQRCPCLGARMLAIGAKVSSSSYHSKF